MSRFLESRIDEPNELHRLLANRSVVDTFRQPFTMVGPSSLRFTTFVWNEEHDRVDVFSRKSYVKWKSPLYLVTLCIGNVVREPMIDSIDWHHTQYINNVCFSKKKGVLSFGFDTMPEDLEIEISTWDVMFRKRMDPVGLYWEENRFVLCALELTERWIEMDPNLIRIGEEG